MGCTPLDTAEMKNVSFPSACHATGMLSAPSRPVGHTSVPATAMLNSLDRWSQGCTRAGARRRTTLLGTIKTAPLVNLLATSYFRYFP